MWDVQSRLETWDGEWKVSFSVHPKFDPSTGDT